MKNESEDQDLIEIFEKLKAEDNALAPSFAVNARQRWSWGVQAPGVAVAAAAAVVCLLFVLIPDRKSPVEPVAQGIAFDELSTVISREIFIASVSEWKSPTQFLLKPDLPTNHH